ncbi:MAG: hypothetical protein JW727_00610 [Candidatus Aenigmarchaeota archaeon]|nr:hypothetical protein [Candidatus Aenigmarchaeota archaeon]
MAKSKKSAFGLPVEQLRDFPGWSEAPIPFCHDFARNDPNYRIDPRAAAWCCKRHEKGKSLCVRDEMLEKMGLTPEEFVKLKEDFSREAGLDAETCYGSLAYCCARNCPIRNRGVSLAEAFKGLPEEKRMEEYHRLKKALAARILRAAKNKELVEPFIEPDLK